MSWAPPLFNSKQREDQWYQSIIFSHNTFCGCGDLVRHFCVVASRFTEPPVVPALPAPVPAPPRRGTEEEGGDRGEDAADRGPYAEEELEDLFAAAREDDMRRLQKTPTGNPVQRNPRNPRRRRLHFTQSTPKRAREQQLGRRTPTRRARDPKNTTPQAAPTPAAATANPQEGNQTPLRRRPPTQKRSPLQPRPIIIPAEEIPDLLFPNTGKKKKFSPFDWETEQQLACWMRRPMRFYPTDPPFYPWLPPKRDIPNICKVNFKINYSE
nr:ORF4 [Torque teno virus]